jgi:hypothetical protein
MPLGNIVNLEDMLNVQRILNNKMFVNFKKIKVEKNELLCLNAVN